MILSAGGFLKDIDIFILYIYKEQITAWNSRLQISFLVYMDIKESGCQASEYGFKKYNLNSRMFPEKSPIPGSTN